MTYQKKLEKWAKRRDKFRELTTKGWTPRRIAEANGLSVQRVYKILEVKTNAQEEK